MSAAKWAIIRKEICKATCEKPGIKLAHEQKKPRSSSQLNRWHKKKRRGPSTKNSTLKTWNSLAPKSDRGYGISLFGSYRCSGCKRCNAYISQAKIAKPKSPIGITGPLQPPLSG